MLKGIWAQAQSEQNAKLEKKALAKTPADAEYVYLETTTKAEELQMLNRGWELVSDNSYNGGVWKAWVRQATLRKLRSQLVLDTEAAAVV